MAEKRAASTSLTAGQLVKRQRSDADLQASGRNGALVQSGSRAGLQSSVMELTGHGGEVFAARFDKSGQYVASGSMDKSVMLWNASGDCANYGVMTGSKGAVLDLHWSRDSKVIYTISAEGLVASWDVDTRGRIRKHEGHDGVVNSLDVSKRGEEILISGGDDGTIGIWDPRSKAAVDYIETEFPITAVALAEAGNELYTGGIDEGIKVWDLRKKSVAYEMKGHTDLVCSLQISPDGQTLLSNSHDSTVRTWDIRPFAPADRHIKTFDGAHIGMEKNLVKASWDASGQKIAAGSGDRSVVVWETRTGKLLHKLPGHKGAVNDVRFSPDARGLILSASSDRNVLLGELSK